MGIVAEPLGRIHDLMDERMGIDPLIRRGRSAYSFDSPPLVCIFGISRLPPVFHLYPACVSLSLVIPVSSYFAADPLYPAVSHYIQLYGKKLKPGLYAVSADLRL